MNEVELSSVTTNAFSNCLNMESISINDNNFPDLPASFAESCVNLRVLSFYQNWIQNIHKNAFKGLANLEELTLNRNNFTFLDPATFNHTPSLNQLQVIDGKLLTIHPDLLATLSLEFVTFSQNVIESLPALKFKDINSLQAINFEKNKISSIDSKILENYPANREQFYFLLSDNVCVSGSYSLKTQLTDWQKCYDNWNEIHPTNTTTTVNVPSTKPSSEPCESCNSHKICRYFLDHNDVYSCVLDNVALTVASIDGQHKTINNQTFTDADVKAVYFKKSILSRVPSVIFTKFPSIESLSIPNTQLTIIDDNTFQLCGQMLKRLDVSKNHITEITKASLVKCQQLQTINLSGNPIEDLDAELFKLDPQLKHVILKQKSYDEEPNILP